MEAADALQMIRVTGTETNWISKFPKRWRGMYTGGGKEGLKGKVRKWSSFYGTTRRGGKEMKGRDKGMDGPF